MILKYIVIAQTQLVGVNKKSACANIVVLFCLKCSKYINHLYIIQKQ